MPLSIIYPKTPLLFEHIVAIFVEYVLKIASLYNNSCVALPATKKNYNYNQIVAIVIYLLLFVLLQRDATLAPFCTGALCKTKRRLQKCNRLELFVTQQKYATMRCASLHLCFGLFVQISQCTLQQIQAKFPMRHLL